jgi:hypothetical protein
MISLDPPIGSDPYTDEELAFLKRLLSGLDVATMKALKDIYDTEREYAPESQIAMAGLNYVPTYPVSHLDRDILMDACGGPSWRD